LSSCDFCADASPLSAGTHSFAPAGTCGGQYSLQTAYLSWAALGSPTITGDFAGWEYDFTLTTTPGDYGWLKYELCEANSGNYGVYVGYFKG
jgi:hypothetical protein